MSEELRKELDRVISIKMTPPALVEDFRGRVHGKGLRYLFGGKGVYRPKDLLEVKHPVLGKLLDWGNLTKKLNEEIDPGMIYTIARDDLRSAGEFLDKVRDVTLNFLLGSVVEGNDIKPTMVPGSSARKEIPNLYIGEEYYSRSDRERLALRLVKSVCVGNNISVYFEGNFHEFLKHLVRRRLDKDHIEASDIRANGLEMDQPFVILIRLLIWIWEQLTEETDAGRMLEELKSSSGVIYFVPVDKERYNTFYFPQLSRFVDTWLKDDSRRKALGSLLHSVGSVASLRGRDAAIKSEVELIYQYLNIVAHSIIETSEVEWEPTRRIVNSLIELFDKYNMHVNLGFVRRLVGAHERSRGGS